MFALLFVIPVASAVQCTTQLGNQGPGMAIYSCPKEFPFRTSCGGGTHTDELWTMGPIGNRSCMTEVKNAGHAFANAICCKFDEDEAPSGNFSVQFTQDTGSSSEDKPGKCSDEYNQMLGCFTGIDPEQKLGMARYTSGTYFGPLPPNHESFNSNKSYPVADYLENGKEICQKSSVYKDEGMRSFGSFLCASFQHHALDCEYRFGAPSKASGGPFWSPWSTVECSAEYTMVACTGWVENGGRLSKAFAIPETTCFAVPYNPSDRAFAQAKCCRRAPTIYPTTPVPSAPTDTPTRGPTTTPTGSPTGGPTRFPTNNPTAQPSATPTRAPSSSPTSGPTGHPTGHPTEHPTQYPTGHPTANPTSQPSASPTKAPSMSPTEAPSALPTAAPSTSPTAPPTQNPTSAPTLEPTPRPTDLPTRGSYDKRNGSDSHTRLVLVVCCFLSLIAVYV